ncbi:MAG: hypothetical protein Q7J46_04155 [Pseudomonas sp.]|nr:hypothetical protein [Pseudomonas sp.]
MEKALILICAGLLISILSFALGVTAGVSTSYEYFTETLVPILSMLGNWVAGLGALGAVLVALWLAEKQKLDDSENLKVNFGFVIISGQKGHLLSVRVVSNGKRPSTVSGVSISSPDASTSIFIANYHHLSSQIPISLGYGAQANFILTYNFENEIASYINKWCTGSANKLELIVFSSLKNYTIKIDKELIENFQKLAEKQKQASLESR